MSHSLQSLDVPDFSALASKLEANLIGELSIDLKNAARSSDDDKLRLLLPNLAQSESRVPNNFRLIARTMRYMMQVSKDNSLQSIFQLLPSSDDLPRIVDQNGWNIAHHCCNIARNSAVIELLVGHCPDSFLEKNNEGQTAIHLACVKQESVELLAEKFSHAFELLDFEGRTPILLACQRSQQSKLVQDVIRWFPQTVQLRDNNGQNAVHAACKHQNVPDVVHRLAAEHSDCFLEKDNMGKTPVHLLLEQQLDIESLEEMLKYDFAASFVECDNRHQTPIHVACECQNKEPVLRLLIEKFPDAFLLEDIQGWTPLHYACSKQHNSKILKLLVDKFSNSGIFNSEGKCGKSGIQLACSTSQVRNCPQLIRVLSNHFTDYFMDSETGLTALSLLAKSFGEDEETIAQLERSPDTGSSPLHTICAKCSEPFIQFLYKALSMNFFAVVDENGQTPIDVAERNGGKHTAIVQNLLHLLNEAQTVAGPANGEFIHCLARLNIRRCLPHQTAKQDLMRPLRFGQFSGEILLHFACLYGHLQNIQYLTSLGSSLAEINDAGRSCLDFAYEKGQQEVVFEACENEGWQMLTLLDPATRVLQRTDLNPQEVINSYQIFSSSKSDSVEVHMLRRAIELDDSTILRSLLLLNRVDRGCMLKTMNILRTDPSFQNFCRKPFNRVGDPIDVALDNGKVNIVFDYSISRQIDVIPTCVRFLIQMQHRLKLNLGKNEQLMELKEKLTAVAVNALDELFYQAAEPDKDLMFRYMSADFEINGERGPMFSYLQLGDNWKCYDLLEGYSSGTKVTCSVFEMIEKAAIPDLFGTACVRKYIDHEWRQPAGFVFAPKFDVFGITLRNKFYFHFLSFIGLLIFLAWYISDFESTMSTIWPDIVVLFIFLSLLLFECLDFYIRSDFVSQNFHRFVIRAPSYCTDYLNIYDVLSIVFLATGLSLKLLLRLDTTPDAEKQYASQMCFATAYLLLGFRAVYLLTYFETTGPLITMIKKLLIKDMLPFMALISVILISFGVFFFSLLRLNCEEHKPYYRILTIPAFLLFGYFEKDFDDNNHLNDGNSTSEARLNSIGRLAYDYVFFFLFLGLVNIVMINLLIALFSESVKSVKSQAYTLWRKSRWHILCEYQKNYLLPPPLTVLEFFLWAIVIAIRTIRSCYNRCTKQCDRCDPLLAERIQLSPESHKKWWEKDLQYYPKEYKDFLEFQATVLRRCRQDLTNKIVNNRDDTAALLAAAENQSQALQSLFSKEITLMGAAQRREISELQQQLQLMSGSFEESLKKTSKKLRDEILNDRLRVDDRIRSVKNKLKEELDTSFREIQTQLRHPSMNFIDSFDSDNRDE